MAIIDLARVEQHERLRIKLLQVVGNQAMEVLRAVSQTEVIRDVLLGLRPGQWKFDASDVVGSKLFASEGGSLHARLVSVVEEEDMTEASNEHLYDGGVDLSRLAVEANGVKAVCGKRHHILLAAGDEQHVTPLRELLYAERVDVRQATAIDESGRT